MVSWAGLKIVCGWYLTLERLYEPDALRIPFLVLHQRRILRLLDLIPLLVVDVLLLSAVFALRPVVTLPGNEQPAGEEDAKDQRVSVAFQGVSHELVEEQYSQHDQQQQEVRHVFGPAWHQREHHAAAHLQRPDDLTEQHRTDANLLQAR